jgi:hypothetical protein
MRDVGIIYLNRFAEGESPVRRFLQSYRDHSAGVDHDLNVVFKGFPDRDSIARARKLFANTPSNFVELDDVGYDIGSYVQAANAVSNRRLIFLNTFSQILADNWLQYFDRAMNLPGVGLVGATASWQALTSIYEGAIKFLMYKRSLRDHLIYNRSASDEAQRPALTLRRYFLVPIEYLAKLYEYGRHPNPHIRTNAFMTERNSFLSLDFTRFAAKSDVYRFESGRRSMTKQIVAHGLRPVVVDRTGKVYEITEWKSSSTFWTNEQENLIIADNQTLDYTEADLELRQSLEDIAWVHPWEWKVHRARPSSRG